MFVFVSFRFVSYVVFLIFLGGDVLVFLPGRSEIEAVKRLLEEKKSLLPPKVNPILYSAFLFLSLSLSFNLISHAFARDRLYHISCIRFSRLSRRINRCGCFNLLLLAFERLFWQLILLKPLLPLTESSLSLLSLLQVPFID